MFGVMKLFCDCVIHEWCKLVTRPALFSAMQQFVVHQCCAFEQSSRCAILLLNVHLDHDEAALPERRALHGESLGSSRVSLVEVVVLVVGHFAVAVRFSEIQVGYVNLTLVSL